MSIYSYNIISLFGRVYIYIYIYRCTYVLVCVYITGDHIQTICISVSRHLSLLNTSRTKLQRIPNVHILKYVWISISKNLKHVLICALLSPQNCILIVSRCLQNNKTHVQQTVEAYPKHSVRGSKNHIPKRADVPKSDPNRTQTYPTCWILTVSKTDLYPKYRIRVPKIPNMCLLGTP